MTWLIALIVGSVIAVLLIPFWKAIQLNRLKRSIQREHDAIERDVVADLAKRRAQMQQENPYLRDVFARKD